MTRINSPQQMNKKLETRKGATTAIGKLQEGFLKLSENYNSFVEMYQKQAQEFANVIDALARIAGNEVVVEKVKEIRKEKLEAESSEQKTQIVKALEEKTLKTIETVVEDSLVGVGVTKPDGSPCYPKTAYAPFERIKPELQAVLRGKKVGETALDPTNGTTVRILEIYGEMVAPMPILLVDKP